jgi:hypothetical protein
MVFVFRFGYETAQQVAANALHGWDDEDSNYIVIDATDEAEALEWGREIAEEYVNSLGGGSWKAGNFAHWVESLSDCPWARKRPVIGVGQRPPAGYWQMD